MKSDPNAPARYSEELAVPEAQNDLFATLRSQLDQSGLVAPAARRALSLLGNYAGAPPASEVRYPTTADQLDKESELYKWFVFNDGQVERGRGMRPNRQFLLPLDSQKQLPSLTEFDWNEPEPRKRW